VFLFDSHSRNELGQPCPNGFSMLIKFKNKRKAEKYILRTYIDATNANVPYELQSLSMVHLNGNTTNPAMNTKKM